MNNGGATQSSPNTLTADGGSGAYSNLTPVGNTYTTSNGQTIGQADISAFLQSTAAKGLTPQQIANLQAPWSVDSSGKVYANGKEITSDLGAVTSFVTARNNDASQYSNYQAAALAQPGESQTIIGGANKAATVYGSNPSTVIGVAPMNPKTGPGPMIGGRMTRG